MVDLYYIWHKQTYIISNSVTVAENPLKEGWYERPLASSFIALLSFQFEFFLEAVSFFQSMYPQKKTRSYISSPGFEPTIFLIHDLENWRLTL